MFLMKGNRVIAHPVYKDGIIIKMQAEASVMPNELPLLLFEPGVREVSVLKFMQWAKDRVMPEERVGLQDAIKSIGLDSYDRWQIVLRTGVHVPYRDDFWIKFTEVSNRVSELRFAKDGSLVVKHRVDIQSYCAINGISEEDFNFPTTLGMGNGVLDVFAGCIKTYDFSKLKIDPSM